MPEWIGKLQASDWIAAYAAVLSTAIAIGQIVGWYKKRPRLEVGYTFRGNAEEGNTITIRNLSDQQMIIPYWELLYCDGRWPRRKFDIVASADVDGRDSLIAPHSTLPLNFTGADHFGWGDKFLRGRRIFMRIVVAGKSPKLVLVYDGR